MFLKEEFRLALEGLPQVVIEIREHQLVRSRGAELPKEQPLSREVGRERFGSSILQHPSNLFFERCGILEFALFGDAEEFFIRNAAPQEKGKSRCQFQVRDAMCGSHGKIGRVPLEAEHKFRIRENAAQSHLDAFVERSSVISSGLVKARQKRQIGFRDRPPKGAMRQVCQDLSRAGGLLTRIRGFADENSGPARCVSRSDDVVRSENFDTGQVRHRRIAELDSSLQVGRCGFEALNQIVNRCVGSQDETSPRWFVVLP